MFWLKKTTHGMWTPSDLEIRRSRRKPMHSEKNNGEKPFGFLSPLDIAAEGLSRSVSDSWPHERPQRNAKTHQQQSNWKDRKGLICTNFFF